MVAFQRVDTIACHNVLITRLDKVAHENSQHHASQCQLLNGGMCSMKVHPTLINTTGYLMLDS